MTLERLSSLTGISNGYLSLLERGHYKITKKTRKKLEKVLGKIDWIETQKIHIRDSGYFEAEKLIQRLVEITLLMEEKDKSQVTELLNKYFMKNGNDINN